MAVENKYNHRATITNRGVDLLELPYGTTVYFNEFDFTYKFQPSEDWSAIALDVCFEDGTLLGERVNVSLQVDNPAMDNWLLVK